MGHGRSICRWSIVSCKDVPAVVYTRLPPTSASASETLVLLLLLILLLLQVLWRLTLPCLSCVRR
jgi:hypothetical protein